MAPPSDGLPAEAAKSIPLVDAFRKYADPKLVTEYQQAKRSLRLRGRWNYIGTPRDIKGWVLSETDGLGHMQLDQTRDLMRRIEAGFIEKLESGDLTAWAREGSPLGPWREIPAAAWSALQIDVPVNGAVKGHGAALFDTRVGPRVEKRVHELLQQVVPQRSPVPSRQRNVAAAAFNAFLSSLYENLPAGDRLKERDVIDAVSKEFGAGTVSRDRVRTWIKEHAPPDKRFERGRRPARRRDLN
jgi:hypothetical protein